jgi:hypothetical protein
MLIPPLFEFGKVTVADPGTPGLERILFRPTEPIDLGQCALLLGWRREDGQIVPLDNYFFWFGVNFVSPPCWIVVFTGKGQDNRSEDNGQPFYFYYWGQESTLFNFSEQIPLLIKFPGVQIGEHLKMLPSFRERQSQLKAPVA